MSSDESTPDELESRWQAVNAALEEMTAQGVDERDERVQELLGELDRIEFEVGMRQRRAEGK